VANGYAYVADGTAVQVVDVRSPSAPVLVAAVPRAAADVAVSGNRLYVLGGGIFTLCDLTDPRAPVVLGSASSWASSVAVVGAMAFLSEPISTSDSSRGVVDAFDVSDPARPTLLKQLVMPGIIRTLRATTNFVYVAESASTIDVIAP